MCCSLQTDTGLLHEDAFMHHKYCVLTDTATHWKHVLLIILKCPNCKHQTTHNSFLHNDNILCISGERKKQHQEGSHRGERPEVTQGPKPSPASQNWLSSESVWFGPPFSVIGQSHDIIKRVSGDSLTCTANKVNLWQGHIFLTGSYRTSFNKEQTAESTWGAQIMCSLSLTSRCSSPFSIRLIF